MNISHFQTFIQVVAEGGFAGAAKKLELTQPAVTLHIQKLEDALGVLLFTRQGRGFELTEAGKAVFTGAQQVAKELVNFESSLEKRLSDLKRSVTIGAGPLTSAFVLPHVIASFGREHPDIDVKAEASETSMIIRGVIDHTFDLGVVGVMVDQEKVSLEEWIEDELVLIVTPDHPFTRYGIIGAEDLLGQQFIWQDRVTGIRQFIQMKCAERKVNLDFSCCKEVGGIESVLNSVNAGLGISFISKVAAAMAIELGKVVRIPIEDCCLIRKIYLVSKKTKKLLPVVEQFRLHMLQYQLPKDQAPTCKPPV